MDARFLIAAAATLGLSLSSSAMAAAAQPDDQPPWLKRPSGTPDRSYYPRAAATAGQAGAALIRCRVAASGDLTSCFVLDEAPQGAGFGAAGVAMAPLYRLNPAKLSGRWAVGSAITAPIRFTLDGGSRVPKLRIVPGSVAMVVTFVKPGERPEGHLFDCPSPADPQRRCQGHPLDWAEQPDLDTATALLAATDLSGGMAILECGPTANGSLSGCRLTGDVTPKCQEAVMALAARFRSKPEAEDHTPVMSGRILVEFDWARVQRLKVAPPPAG